MRLLAEHKLDDKQSTEDSEERTEESLGSRAGEDDFEKMFRMDHFNLYVHGIRFLSIVSVSRRDLADCLAVKVVNDAP